MINDIKTDWRSTQEDLRIILRACGFFAAYLGWLAFWFCVGYFVIGPMIGRSIMKGAKA